MGEPQKGELKLELPDDARPSPDGAHITLDRFNTPTRNILRKFDDNGDGKIDSSEIQAVVSRLVAEKFKSKAFKVGLITLGVFTIILLGATFGLTWAVVAALKDTRVQGGVLVSNDGSRATVMTASTELLVQQGRLVERGPDGASTGNVLSTAAYMGRAALSPDMPMNVLLGVQTLVLSTPSGGQLALSVQAIARIPVNTTSSQHVLKLQTPAGLLVVEEDGSLAVQGEPGQLLKDAGFNSAAASSGRRHLLEATRYYIFCSTHDCTSWTPDQVKQCGGNTGISCDQVGDDYLIIDELAPSPSPTSDLAYDPTQNSGTTGSSGCGSAQTVISSSCLSAAELCYNNGNLLLSSDWLDQIARSNYKCRQSECQNGLIWGWTNAGFYQFLNQAAGPISYCSGSKSWTFCCS